MEPSEVASYLMEKLINYCINASDDYYECMANAMEGLDRVLYDYLIPSDRVPLEIVEAIENSDTFRDEVEKELEEMLNDFWARTIANDSDGLSGLLDELYRKVVNDPYLIDFRKVRILKAYEKVLEEFADVVDRALKEKKPLSKKDLYDWYMNIGETVIGTEAYDLIDPRVDFWLHDFYDMLNNDYKLEMLAYILNYINNDILPKIKKTLSELEALTNK